MWKLVTENIQIPGGENMSLWDLMFGPYEDSLPIREFFWVGAILLVAGLMWVKTESVGMPIIFFIIANATLGQFTQGSGAVIFWICMVLGILAIFFRALVGRKN